MSRINIGSPSALGPAGPQVSERSCATGNCTTIDIPGPSK
jgi:hypothetical protein